jgi:hypothetical protein
MVCPPCLIAAFSAASSAPSIFSALIGRWTEKRGATAASACSAAQLLVATAASQSGPSTSLRKPLMPLAALAS